MFNNAHQSHEHSLVVLNELREHDTFMESVGSVADMGAGGCLDALWWSTITTRDDVPEPLNLKCYAVDRDPQRVDFDLPTNLSYLQRDFEKPCLPSEVDVIWCHDAFQYALNPINTLRVWNQQMNVNGLLYIGLPLLSYMEYGRYHSVARSHHYYNHNFLSMVYMLAVNGFDCKDAYFRKAKDDPWLHIAVFKTDIQPMNPSITSWYDLIELGLVSDTLSNSFRTFGYIREQDALFPWLDKSLYRIDS